MTVTTLQRKSPHNENGNEVPRGAQYCSWSQHTLTSSAIHGVHGLGGRHHALHLSRRNFWGNCCHACAVCEQCPATRFANKLVGRSSKLTGEVRALLAKRSGVVVLDITSATLGQVFALVELRCQSLDVGLLALCLQRCDCQDRVARSGAPSATVHADGFQPHPQSRLRVETLQNCGHLYPARMGSSPAPGEAKRANLSATLVCGRDRDLGSWGSRGLSWLGPLCAVSEAQSCSGRLASIVAKFTCSASVCPARPHIAALLWRLRNLLMFCPPAVLGTKSNPRTASWYFRISSSCGQLSMPKPLLINAPTPLRQSENDG